MEQVTTECWFRNPHNFIKELVETGESMNVAWDRGILVKKHIDPLKHAQLYFGESADFRVLCIGRQGTAEIDKDHSLENPAAVYPTWEYGENIDILEEMMSSNIGYDINACTADVPVDQRPVPNQEHRVVVTNLPNIQMNANRAFYRQLKVMQEDNPDCILHIHGTYSFRVAFGMGFGAADIEPRGDAANGRVILPNGKIQPFARLINQQQWCNLIGFSVPELKDPRNRCMFNIRSAVWAAEHWDDNLKFQSQGEAEVDTSSPNTVVPTTAKVNTALALAPKDGDKIVCDKCSLADSCKYFRVGSVCTIPGSESAPLVRMFKSRDSSQIIDALGTLQAAGVKRLQRGMEEEEEFGELDPEVTKMMAQLFNQGLKLAKVVDPTLNKPGVQINMPGSGGGTSGNGLSSKQIMAEVVRTIEQGGVKREDITADMVENVLRQMGFQDDGPHNTVQGQVG